MSTIEKAQVYYHVSASKFEIGDTIEFGKYGSSLKNSDLSEENDPNGEWLREQIRAEHYPDKPSRMSCIYIFDNKKDAVRFREFHRKGCSIYEVLIISEEPKIHKICYSAWTMDYPDLEQQAHDYWSSPPVYSTNSEIFVESDLEVTNKLIGCPFLTD